MKTGGIKMNESYNWKSLFAGLVIILVGIILCVASAFNTEPWNNILLSTGCSLIASGLVILMHDFFIERKKTSPIDSWKLQRIAMTRSDINSDCSAELKKAKYQVDIVAFGLQSFRNKQSREIESYLKKGINFRILAMNPNSEFVKAREVEEDDTNIKNSIEKLVVWANQLNSKKHKGKIIIKGYNCMTLDFYWRVDNIVYVGPYWYGYDSQQTITYKFAEGGNGYSLYTNYFEKLWEDTTLSEYLTQVTEFKKK